MASSLAAVVPRLLAFSLSLVLAVGGLTVGSTTAAQAAPGPVAGSKLVMPVSVTDKIAPSHPYLLAKSADWTRIKALTTTDVKAKDARIRLLTLADATLVQPPQKYEFQDSLRILSAAIKVKERVYLLGTAYQLTGDVKYAQRGYEEMASAASWPSWNPPHFLDTAEVTNGMGVGYDWFYSYMTPEQRTIIRTAIVTKGLQPGLSNYREPARSNFAASTSNWNNVSNGGMIVGALAIAKEEKALAEEVLQYALPSSLKGLQQWAPDGGYAEGVGYWSYAMQYTAVTLAALNSATGSDFGLSQEPGLATAANFPLYSVSNAGGTTAFNFGDDYPSQPVVVENLYLGKLYNNPVYTYQGQQALIASTDPKALLWYDPTLVAKTPAQAGLAPDAYFRNSEVVTMRGGWGSPEATFAAVKASAVRHGHADLDLGDFVFSAMGEAWATELGRDDYNFPGYFDEDTARWDFYRKRAEGQNTLVFNPEQKVAGPDAAIAGTGVFQTFFSTPTEAGAVTELTAAAPTDVKSWKRGVTLFDNKTQVLVQDEVLGQDSLKSAWWFMNTDAAIEVAPDGRSAVLTKVKNGQALKVLARLVSSNTSLAFTSMTSQALPTSPNARQETPTGSRKLAINIAGSKDFTLGVQLTPLRESTAPPVASLKPLAQWQSGTATPPTVAGLKINGVPLAGFSPATRSYDVLPYNASLQTVTADKKSSTDTVTITQAPAGGGRATVTVKSGTATATYYIYFRTAALPLAGVTASYSNATETPANTLDGDSSTRWAFNNAAGGWLRYDLGTVKQVPTMEVSWQVRPTRGLTYLVETSSDAKNWTKVTTKTSSTSSGIDTIPVNRSARYVKLSLTPASADPWASVRDVRFYAPAPVSAEASYIARATLTLPKTSLVLQEAMQATVGTFTKSGTPVAPSSGSKLTYTSSVPSVASVSPTGFITGLAPGTTKLTAQVVDPVGRTTNWASTVITVSDPTKATVAPTADTWVNGGENIDRGFGTASQLAQKSMGDNSSTDRATYMTFTVPTTPAGMKIGEARLVFSAYVNDTNGSSIRLTVAPTATAIDELKTTWRTKPALGAPIGGVDVDYTQSRRTILLTEYLTAAMPAGGQQLPLGFGQTLTTSRSPLNVYISSREAAQELQPRLEVDYIPLTALVPAPPVKLTPTADTWVNGGTNALKVVGATATTLAHKNTGDNGPTDRATFMEFPLPATPAGHRIASATFSFTAFVSDGNGTTVQLNAHEVASSIDETSMTWATKPALGPQVASTVVNGTSAVRTIDLKPYAQQATSAGKKTIALGFSQTLIASKYGLSTYISSRETTSPPTLLLTYEPLP